MVGRGIFILCIAFFAGNASANIPRILNGFDARIEDFPYQVSLRKGNWHTCGGSIISERYILTAGHCVSDDAPPYDWIKVVTGTSHRVKGGVFRDIANITIHPEFSTDGNRGVNDVAVITLKDKIKFDKYQQQIRLPAQNFTVGQRVNLTGWGRVRQIPPIRPLQLQKLRTKLISIEECQSQVIDPARTIIDGRDVCTVVIKDTGMCLGDSGGPLAANGELIGIVSWTDGDYCAGGHPDVYSNVYAFKDFIESAMKQSV